MSEQKRIVMPKNDMQSLWALFEDLARELSWILRIFFFGGMFAGLALGIYWTSQVPSEELRRGFLRLIALFILGMTALGAILGLAAGVIVELIITAIVGKADRDDRSRRDRRNR